MPETDKGEYEAFSEVQKVRNYEEFEGIDNNVECSIKMKILRMKLLIAFYQNTKTRN
jgi:hypothetical protein